MTTQHLGVRKTYKLHIGGAFVRSESGRVLPALSPTGAVLDHYGWASRKDLRDAVVAARAAFDGWAKRTAYLRGQILYRAAEMLQNRAAELANEIQRSTGVRLASGIDRAKQHPARAGLDLHVGAKTDRSVQCRRAVMEQIERPDVDRAASQVDAGRGRRGKHARII